mmetsp:Transcript_59772/g.106254  ORF Transcript_59772/g.106254 Transcript_59772/m.106254 type:complete len:88 (+) Transcript_59772:3062-3325(+)
MSKSANSTSAGQQPKKRTTGGGDECTRLAPKILKCRHVMCCPGWSTLCRDYNLRLEKWQSVASSDWLAKRKSLLQGCFCTQETASGI